MIVNSTTDYNTLNKLANTEPCIVAIIPIDPTRHPSVGKISFVYYHFKSGQSYILGITHPDTLISTPNNKIIIPSDGYIINKKEALHLNKNVKHLKDINSLWYVNNMAIPNLSTAHTPWMDNFVQMFDNTKILNKPVPINNLIPLTVWHNILRKFSKELFDNMPSESKSFSFFDQIVMPTLYELESAGLAVNVKKFLEKFENKAEGLTENKVYTNYNPFTITGRPSNAHLGINYAALNKSDGSRSVFESRFGSDGILMQIDFDAYHLRLLAYEMGMNLGKDSLHEILAKQYFNKQDISQEEYEESKRKTFQFLYSNSLPDGDMPRLLKRIHEHRLQIATRYDEHNHFETPSGRQIEVIDGAANKIFNYYVQALEAESTYKILYTLVENIRELESRAVLYTYDSVLFDVRLSEVNKLRDIIESSIDTEQFPITVSMGYTYDNLTDI